MRFLHKILLNFVLIALVILFYAIYFNESKQRGRTIIEYSTHLKQSVNNDVPNTFDVEQKAFSSKVTFSHKIKNNLSKQDDYNIWSIFTKVSKNSPMKQKFGRFAQSLVKHSSVVLKLHLIVDYPSKYHAEEVFKRVKTTSNKTFDVFYYEVNDLADQLQDIISSMQPYFSSQPGSYYSDALFFLSLGLHRIAKNQTKAIMFDIDTKVLTDVVSLFQEFEKFHPTALFGLVPELSPVYRHVLYSFRSKYKYTVFGDSIQKGGFPGVNSGVIMFNLEKIRKSKKYNDLLKPEAVHNLTTKYTFKGHLGDQDFYTLLGMEQPSMIHILGCEWNRQLCKWWKSHGYQDVFDEYFRCEKQIKVYHGNCNSEIPNSDFFPV